MISSHPTITNQSIRFWINVAKYEKQIIERSQINGKRKIPSQTAPLNPLLCESESGKLLPVFISFIEGINENDTEVDDVKSKTYPHMYSVIALQLFYGLAPEEIFNSIRNRIEEDISKDDKWTQLHAGVLLMYSIVEKPFNQTVSEFLSNYIDKLIELSSPTHFPRLRETSLYVLNMIMTNYPETILSTKESDKLITSLISLFESTISSVNKEGKNDKNELTILCRISNSIFSISSLWKRNTHESRLEDYFYKLYEIDGSLFNIGINNDDKTLIQNASESLNQLIFNATPSLIPKLIDLDRSKEIENNDNMTADIGCENFASPEQLGSSTYSYETDIYSIGKVIYFIITGKIPNNQSLLQFPKEYQFMAQIFDECTSNSPFHRPNISLLINIFISIVISQFP